MVLQLFLARHFCLMLIHGLNILFLQIYYFFFLLLTFLFFFFNSFFQWVNGHFLLIFNLYKVLHVLLQLQNLFLIAGLFLLERLSQLMHLTLKLVSSSVGLGMLCFLMLILRSPFIYLPSELFTFLMELSFLVLDLSYLFKISFILFIKLLDLRTEFGL